MEDYIMPEWIPEESWDDTDSDDPECSNVSSPTIQRTKEDEENTQSIMDVPSDTDTPLDTKEEEEIRTESVEQLDSEAQDNQNKKEKATSTQDMDPDEILDIGKGYMKTHKFGRFVSTGQQNALQLEREKKLLPLLKLKPLQSMDSSAAVLFGEQECFVEDKNWRYMEHIDYGGLLHCIHCHKPTGVISFKTRQPKKGEKAKKGGKIPTDRIETRFYCDCKGDDLYGMEDKAFSSKDINRIREMKPVPTGIPELDKLTGCRWYHNVMLLVGQP